MGPERHARPQQVPGHVGAAVRPVVDLVVAERLSDPERVEGLAVDDAPAGAKVGGDVDVGVDEAGDAPVRPRPRERLAAGGDGGLGEGRASSRALEAKRSDALRAGARHRKRPAVGDRRQRPPGRRRPEREGAPPLTLGSPLARRAGGARPLDMDVPASVRRPPRQAQEAAVSVIEEVAPRLVGSRKKGIALDRPEVASYPVPAAPTYLPLFVAWRAKQWFARRPPPEPGPAAAPGATATAIAAMVAISDARLIPGCAGCSPARQLYAAGPSAHLNELIMRRRPR